MELTLNKSSFLATQWPIALVRVHTNAKAVSDGAIQGMIPIVPHLRMYYV